MRIVLIALTAVFLTQTAYAQNCRSVVEQAIDTGILRLGDADASGVWVSVADSFWTTSNGATRRGMLNAIECAIAGKGKVLRRLKIVSMGTGRVVAVKEMGKIEIKE